MPALIASGGAAIADGGEVTVNVRFDADVATATESAIVEDVTPGRTATADDYGLLLVPVGTTGFAFAVIVEFARPEAAAVWSFAVFLITILAMRDEDFGKAAARAADWLRPPRD